MCVFQRGIVGMDVIWHRLCLKFVYYELGNANVWWRCAQYFVIASYG